MSARRNNGADKNAEPNAWRESPPGTITSMLLPRFWISPVTKSVAPCPIACMITTAATPITTPSVVSSERSVLRRSALAASDNVVSGFMRVAAPGPRRSRRGHRET
jgi:hypothetical protein